MSEQHENPAAFPSVCLDDPGHPASAPGMTLRDWFAGQFAGGCANGLTHVPEDDEELAQFRHEIGRVAQLSYMMADAMLAARSAQVPA
ncbi:hypothetical protein CA235_07270 [Sphingomonas sp. ABOLF]|uniref:hypothetical protein n=1 Tax=Sphingomonas sp. ABOLF TaxID=1985879 RepID=UPI000F7DD803|nr:hypothetical protein [Sphingomonas sp. ABOLF]RSV15646.1 hypothetical protein CA235_07270 [Sphingomonas sp. ABOLF]